MLDTSIAAVPEPSTRRLPRRWVWIVVAVTAVAVLLGAGWWLTHPDVFGGQGSTLTTAPVKVDSTVLAGLPMSGPIDLTLISVRPNIVRNTAHASVDVVLCTAKGGDVLGSGRSPLPQWCSSVREPRGVTLHGLTAGPTHHGDYLVIVITPRWPGVVRVDGVKVHYREGLRTGTQITGMTVIVPSR